MSPDNIALWVDRYRSSVEETQTPLLDAVILEAAKSQSTRHRRTRRSRQVSLLAAFAVLSIGTLWSVHQPRSDQSHTVTGYGRFEGVSRSYLLEVETLHFTGFGISEGSP